MKPISLKDFLKFSSEGYNRVPIMRQVSADLDTPLSVYMKLVSGPNSYLLESVHGGEKFGRYSFVFKGSRKQCFFHTLSFFIEISKLIKRIIFIPK